MNRSKLSLKLLVVSSLSLLLIGAFLGYVEFDILRAIARPALTGVFMTNEMYTLMNLDLTETSFIVEHIILFLSGTMLFILGLYIVWFRATFSEAIALWKNNKLKILMISSIMFVSCIVVFSSFYMIPNSLIVRDEESVYTMLLIVFLINFFAFVVLFLCTKWIGKSELEKNTSIKSTVLWSGLLAVIITIFYYLIASDLRVFVDSLLPLGGAGEVTLVGWKRITYIFITFGSLLTASTGAFIIYSLKPKPLSNILVPSVLMIVAIILGQSYVNYANEKFDMRFKSLSEAAGLTVLATPPAQQRILYLNDNNRSTLISQDRRSSKFIRGFDKEEKIDLIEENKEKLSMYLQRGQNTFYSDTAMSALIKINELDFDITEYRKNCLNSMYHRGQIIHAIKLFVSAIKMPVTEANLHFLNEISNEDVFHISGQSAYVLSELWANFANEKKARYFYDKAGKEEQSESWEELLKQNRFNKGKLTGKIRGLNAHAKVVLIESSKYNDGSFYDDEFHNVKAVQNLSEQGEFLFENLVNGEYTLAIIIPDPQMRDLKSNVNRSYSISENMPEFKDIDILISSAAL